jgi:hypothetical protein
MNVLRICKICLFSCMLLPLSAWCSWSGFVSMGTAVALGNPSCAQLSSGDVACAARSLAQTFLVDTYNGTAWSGWKSLPGIITSSPACTSDGNGKVYCASTSSTSSLLVTVFNGTTWSTPASVGGQLTSAPSCASYTANKVLCVARNLTGGLAWITFNGTAWNTFANITATTVSAPGCTGDGAGGVICAVNTLNTSSKTQPVLVNRFNGSSWQGFLNIAGVATTEPTCTGNGISGQVVCFARGTDSGLWDNRFNGGSWVSSNWSGWFSLGGHVGKSGWLRDGDCGTACMRDSGCRRWRTLDRSVQRKQLAGMEPIGWYWHRGYELQSSHLRKGGLHDAWRQQ